MGCLVVFGLFAAVMLRGMVSGSGRAQWRPVRSLDVPTRQFHSPYPWVGVVRHADGQPGYLVYAPVDQIPSDWPPVGLTRGEVQGYWQFVLADGSVEPGREGVCEYNNVGVTDATALGFETPVKALQAMVSPDSEGPPSFDLTPAGRQALASSGR
jgi:hypothetical protein